MSNAFGSDNKTQNSINELFIQISKMNSLKMLLKIEKNIILPNGDILDFKANMQFKQKEQDQQQAIEHEQINMNTFLERKRQ